MINEGKPTEELAFPDNESVGTWDMINRLQKAGIPTYVYGKGWLPTQ